jgi:UTP-glucose-1-phosphate uridylyltransferase
MKNPMDDEQYDGNDEQIADLKDLVIMLEGKLQRQKESLQDHIDTNIELRQQLAECGKVLKAVENLIATKGRFHTERAFNELKRVMEDMKDA